MTRWFEDAGNPDDPRIVFVGSDGVRYQGYVSELDEIRRRDPGATIPLAVVSDRKSLSSQADREWKKTHLVGLLENLLEDNNPR